MVLPALGSQRIPVRIKIILSLFITLLISPGLDTPEARSVNLFTGVAKELSVGIAIGLLSRLLFNAAEAAGSIIAMMIGMTNAFAGTNEESESLPILATILSLFMAMMIFVTDLHHLMIVAVRRSYDIVPIAGSFGTQEVLGAIVDASHRSAVLALQISAPFVIIGMVANLTAGILNRIVQQVPIYFVITPVVTFIGLVVLSIVSTSIVMSLSAAMMRELR
jgi:flagellar biosynthetic protein FliR